MKRKVLVCGGGVAGLTAAYWLQRWGFVATVVERAPGPRPGGPLLDFWGPGYDVLERMGLRTRLIERDLRIPRVTYVDERGGPKGGLDVRRVREHMQQRFASVTRGALVAILHEGLKSDVEVIFGDTVAALALHADRVDVELERGGARRFDLVLGADGLRSQVRRLVFGGDSDHVRPAGFTACTFEVEEPLPTPGEGAVAEASGAGADDVLTTFTSGKRQLAVYRVDERRVSAQLVFASGSAELADRDSVLAAARAAFAGVERAEALLARAPEAPAFSFEALSRVHVPSWSHHRVALVGDAAACPAWLPGRGASLAMAGAYVLAGELNAAAGGHKSAYARYEQLMRPLVDDPHARTPPLAASLVTSSMGAVGQHLRRLRLSSPKGAARYAAEAGAPPAALHVYD